MPLSKLSIFSKDTDANEVVKGYEYQKLRTLETWLSNKINKVDELIYCEYEDDIFQRDLELSTSKFIQIKLYASKSFSFNSEEVTKAIANFFMLFVKGEYSFDRIQFIFETNTSIASKYLDNDAQLLKKWYENQDNLSEELIGECSTKVRSIVTKYIKEELPKVSKNNKSEAQSAVIDFNQLPESVWEDFTKSIKWTFNNESSNSAIEKVVNSIKNWISELPFPSVEEKLDIVFTTLYYEVSVRMFQDEPSERCLTNQKIDSLILDLGNDADRQYKVAFEAWKNTTEITYFNLAEFLEVLHSANYCRYSPYLKEHSELWLGLLNQFILSADTPDRYRQKAVYEFLWLSLRPRLFKKAEGSLIGLDSLIEQYFLNAPNFDDHESVENHLSLVQIVRAEIILENYDLEIEKTEPWVEGISSVINEKIDSAQNLNEKCYWLELQTNFLSNPLDFRGDPPVLIRIFEYYSALIKLLPQAPLYNVNRLSYRLNQFIKLYIRVGGNDKFVDALEKLVDELMPYVLEKNGKHEIAKTYVDRGYKYIRSKNPLHLARGLEYFHKAKDLWFQAETSEGYVLALLSISQLYSALSMNLAAKYYALSAVWHSINNNPEKLAKRIASGFGLLVYCDFKQGSWFNALDSFEIYINARLDFDKRPLDETDEMFTKSLIQIATILSFAPQISTQLAGYIEFSKQRMGVFYEEFLEHLVMECDKILLEETLQNIIQDKLDASPINDIGAKRTIEWKAFGSIWSISFPNTWMYNSLGEEYAATLQIFQIELSSSLIDFHFIKTQIEIEIVEFDEIKEPEQQPSNMFFKWKVFTKKIETADKQEIIFQVASLVLGMKYLIRDVSMLEDAKIFEIVENLLKKESLAEKTLTSNLYQRIYRTVFAEKHFNISQRNIFRTELSPIALHEDKVLEWNSKVSPLYSTEKSLELIEGRYKNSAKFIYLTIAHLKSLPGYHEWLDALRKKGWLDWQILLSIYNHVMSYKANRVVSLKKFVSNIAKQEGLRAAIFEIQKKDERETYIQFPLDYFKGKEFEFQLDQVAFLVLKNWGLENRAQYPNFNAIKDFLDTRFNYGVDDRPSLSPL